MVYVPLYTSTTFLLNSKLRDNVEEKAKKNRKCVDRLHFLEVPAKLHP